MNKWWKIMRNSQVKNNLIKLIIFKNINKK